MLQRHTLGKIHTHIHKFFKKENHLQICSMDVVCAKEQGSQICKENILLISKFPGTLKLSTDVSYFTAGTLDK